MFTSVRVLSYWIAALVVVLWFSSASAHAQQPDPEEARRAVEELRSHGYQVETVQPAATPATQGATAKPAEQKAPEAVPAEDANAPVGTSQPNPYGSLPSLNDLYHQVPAPSGVPSRFGMEIFRNGSGNSDTVPADLPAGPDYVLGPGDGLEIDLWGGVSQRIKVAVDREGRVALPEAGTLLVSGLTLDQAQERISKILAPQFRNVKVDVSLARVRTVRVYVVGEVQRPGAYDISSLSTPLNALYMAGGPTSRGSLRMVRHYRGKQLVRTVDFYDFLLHGIRSDVERLQPGDTILVPPVGSEVTITGMVRRPAMYELSHEKDLAEVVDLAGGVLVSATYHHITVERIVAHDQRVLLSLDLRDGADPSAVTQALKSFQVQDGDKVNISPITPYSNETIYLEGHVVRPGKYPYRTGMQLSDVIRSYKDLLPESAEHGELIRLEPPEYRPVATEFNLDELVSGEDPIELKPFDTIRIFGRYERDAPKVSISGEVMRPGEYPFSKGMTVGELVRFAGGFKRNAYREDAEFTSYVVQNGQKVLLDRKMVAIGKAADGDRAADQPLKPYDQLQVRQLAGLSQIGAGITLSGEVVHPGRFTLREGERLSSVIQRAGGFNAEAYPEGAMLQRAEIRQIQEGSRAELVRRIETEAVTTRFSASSSAKDDDQAGLMRAMQQQQQQVVANLKTQPASGRLVITISTDVAKWANTNADVALRNGDVISIPQRPDYVVVNGQVYNPTAVSFKPGRSAGWYLQRAGGTTDMANKKAIFVVRVNGSVVADKGKALSSRLQPGDSIVVPAKVVGGSNTWKYLMNIAQITTAIALATSVATR